MIKIQRFSTGGASRGESAFTFLSDVVSLLSHVTRLPLASLSLSPWQLLLSIARYLCHLEKAAALTSRSRRHFFFLVFDLSLLAHLKILSHLLSFHRSIFGVASQLATSHILCRTLSVCVTPFSSTYINTLPNFLSASLAKLNGSDGLTQTISQSPSMYTLMSRISS